MRKTLGVFSIIALSLSACNFMSGGTTPAISYEQSISDLKRLEKNKLFNEDTDIGTPGSIRNTLEWKQLEYVTQDDNILQYNFMKDKLVATLVKYKDRDFESLLAEFRNNNSYEEFKSCVFINGDDIIRIGVDDKNTPSAIYMNNVDDEISKFLETTIGQDLNSSTRAKNNEVFFAQLILSFMGRASVMQMIDNSSNTYYNSILVQ